MTGRPAALAFAALILSGCTRIEIVDDGLGYERRQAELARFTSWDLSGGIIVDTGEDRGQSRFTWRQRDNRLELEINGRLGVGRALIEGDESSLMIQARGETRVLTDPERELSEMLGWWMPVTSAEHWLLGRPDPDYPGQTLPGVFDTVATLTQRDWQIAYDQYQLVDGRLVPERITLTHAPLELRLRITDFEPVIGEP